MMNTTTRPSTSSRDDDEESALPIGRNNQTTPNKYDDQYEVNPYLQEQLYYDPERDTLGRRIIIASLTLFIIACGIASLILYSTFPDPPLLDVESASVSGFESPSSPYKGTLNVSLLFGNHNKDTDFVYESIHVFVVYKDGPNLANTTIASFEQARNANTTIKVEFGISAGEYMAEDRKHGIAHFVFEFDINFSYKSGKQKPTKTSNQGICNDVKIEFKSGALYKGDAGCYVGSNARQQFTHQSTK